MLNEQEQKLKERGWMKEEGGRWKEEGGRKGRSLFPYSLISAFRRCFSSALRRCLSSSPPLLLSSSPSLVSHIQLPTSNFRRYGVLRTPYTTSAPRRSFSLLPSPFSLSLITIYYLLFTIYGLFAAVKITPVANVSLLGGQYFLEGENDSFAGNADVFFSPVVNFSANTALLPIYQGVYSGTKDVRELIGGGTLTREVLDNSLTLKLTHKFSDTFKGKIKAGYKMEYLKETEDEKLGDGLFDYNRLIAGLEAEKKCKSWNIRTGCDFYIMTYPNYASLITTYQTSIDTATYTEVSENAGEDVLDYSTYELFIEGLHSFSETTVGKILYDIAYKSFKDQTLVQVDGSFSSTKRSDFIHLLTFGVAKNLPKITSAIYNTVEYYDSNQNSYDANRTTYNEGYYDFIQNDVTPSITLTLGKSTKLNLWWDIAYRKYSKRRAQDEQGNYKTTEITQTTNTTGISVLVPIYKALSIKTAGSYRDSSSNNRYEANYRYNYSTFNYFAGVNWER